MDLCFMTPNNKHSSSPPRMSDGRHFTDYRSNCLINSLLVKNNRVHSSHDYKQFLVDNADKLRQLNWHYACQKNCHKDCSDEVDIPHESEIECNEKTCRKRIVNSDGIGIRVHSKNINNIYQDDLSTVSSDSPKNNCDTNKNNFDFFFNK